MTTDEILAHLRQIMQDTFDLDPERVTLDARLYQDLDIDSIDAVDLIVKLKPLAGKRLQPEASVFWICAPDTVRPRHEPEPKVCRIVRHLGGDARTV